MDQNEKDFEQELATLVARMQRQGKKTLGSLAEKVEQWAIEANEQWNDFSAKVEEAIRVEEAKEKAAEAAGAAAEAQAAEAKEAASCEASTCKTTAFEASACKTTAVSKPLAWGEAVDPDKDPFPHLNQAMFNVATPYQDADLVYFGAPWDSTVSYRPGSRFGPQGVRSVAFGGGIETYSPYQDADLEDHAICDGGDLALPFGMAEETMARLEATVTRLLSDNKKFIMIGGEHSLTQAPFKACLAKYPDLEMLHFDAHADEMPALFENKYSHGSVMRRCWEMQGVDKKVHSFGIRSAEKAEWAFSQAHIDFHPFSLNAFAGVCEELAEKKVPVYLSLDLDVLDPSAFPGTGTPEPGGATFSELLKALLALGRTGLAQQVVGADIMELAPDYDSSGCSSMLAAKVLRELTLLMLG